VLEAVFSVLLVAVFLAVAGVAGAVVYRLFKG
jgi:hypothetical protein